MKQYRHKLNTLHGGGAVLPASCICLCIGLGMQALSLPVLGTVFFILSALLFAALMLLLIIEQHQDDVLNREAMQADEKLEAAIKKKSFSLPYHNGEIWCEHLDGLYYYTELVIHKFQNDLARLQSPSAPSAIAINLDETAINDELLHILCSGLCSHKKHLQKIAFIGISKKDRPKMKLHLINASVPFQYRFFHDFEKAKEWLISI